MELSGSRRWTISKRSSYLADVYCYCLRCCDGENTRCWCRQPYDEATLQCSGDRQRFLLLLNATYHRPACNQWSPTLVHWWRDERWGHLSRCARDPRPRLMIKHGEIKQTTQYFFACAGAESDKYNTFLPVQQTDILNVQVKDESLRSDVHKWLSLSLWY